MYLHLPAPTCTYLHVVSRQGAALHLGHEPLHILRESVEPGGVRVLDDGQDEAWAADDRYEKKKKKKKNHSNRHDNTTDTTTITTTTTSPA